MLEEYNLELDDVRWYCAALLAERLLSYKDKKKDLIRFIWSGELEGELYNMEEQFVEDLQDEMERNLQDEPHIRAYLNEIGAARDKRFREEI
jgi:hypothetical protein